MAKLSSSHWARVRAEAEQKKRHRELLSAIANGSARDPRFDPAIGDVTQSRSTGVRFRVTNVESNHVHYVANGINELFVPLDVWRLHAREDRVLSVKDNIDGDI